MARNEKNEKAYSYFDEVKNPKIRPKYPLGQIRALGSSTVGVGAKRSSGRGCCSGQWRKVAKYVVVVANTFV